MPIAIGRYDEDGNVSSNSAFEAPIDLCRVQCHYCGYEPSDHLHLPHRCPKCSGSAWEHYELRGGMLAIAGIESGERAEVEFKLHCPAVHAYLFGNVRPDSPRLIEMDHVAEDDWSTRVSLPPGQYFYRFYINDGRLVFYVGTTESLNDLPAHSFIIPGRNASSREEHVRVHHARRRRRRRRESTLALAAT